MTATERLDQWAALADGATEAPWVVQDGDEVHAPHLLDQDEASDVATIFDANADAAFIAASREAVPALIAALRAVLDEHRPGHVYLLTDECGHDHDDDSDDRVGRDDWGDAFCLDSPTGETFCTGCIGPDESNLPYPCPTVRAITSALDGA